MSCEEEHCITCGDIADELTVLAVDEERELALCDTPSGAHQTVEIALLCSVRPGDRILVHAGTAIAHASTTAGATR